MKAKAIFTGTAVLLVFCSSISGNPIPNDRPDGTRFRATSLYYENASGEKALSTYDYDSEGFLKTAVWEQFDKVRNSINYYYYDDSGRLIRKNREFSDRLFTTEQYIYDADRRLVKETYERSDGVTGSAVHTYDKSGCRIKTVCDKHKGWLTGEIYYKCNQDGQPVSALMKRDADSLATIEYSYDEYGNLIKEYWDCFGQWSQTFIYTYGQFKKVAPDQYISANVFINNDNGYRVAGETYEYSDGTGGPSKYEYDNSGKLVRKRYDHSTGLYTKTTFLYDFDGRLTKSYRLYSSGLSGVFSYEFDDMGKLKHRTFTRSDGKTADELYEYDESGRLVSGTVKNFDNWLTGSLTFAYDDNNQLSSGLFKGENNFDADIRFEFDDAGNLIKYVWNFSFGDSQTYNFEYENIKDESYNQPMKQTGNIQDKEPIVFVCNVGSPEQLSKVYCLAKSIRDFGGKYSQAPVWVYASSGLIEQEKEAIDKIKSLQVEIKPLVIPEEASWFYLSGMVFTAAAAEAEAKGMAANLVMMGSDTIILDQPDEFVLPDGISLGYRPVMHNNISPLYNEPLNEYWSRAYDLMQIDESKIFPITTPADEDEIRAYFNAGCMAVLPEKGIFAKWADNYALLYDDAAIRKMAEEDVYKRIFTFQVALVGAVLNNVDRSEMINISDKYNYPIFFKEMYGGKNDFHDINGIVTIRCEDFFLKPIPGWDKILKGPRDRINWIAENILRADQ